MANSGARSWARLRSSMPNALLVVGIFISLASPASAQRIENTVAVFAALDKVTARISRLEVKLNETVTFGALKVTPRICYSRPPTEQPKTSTFVVVTETQLDGGEQRLFSGWMFAESPGLNAVEHPVYDLWLTDCQQPVAAAATAGPAAAPGDAKDQPAQDATGDRPRRRPPR